MYLDLLCENDNIIRFVIKTLSHNYIINVFYLHIIRRKKQCQRCVSDTVLMSKTTIKKERKWYFCFTKLCYTYVRKTEKWGTKGLLAGMRPSQHRPIEGGERGKLEGMGDPTVQKRDLTEVLSQRIYFSLGTPLL